MIEKWAVFLLQAAPVLLFVAGTKSVIESLRGSQSSSGELRRLNTSGSANSWGDNDWLRDFKMVGSLEIPCQD